MELTKKHPFVSLVEKYPDVIFRGKRLFWAFFLLNQEPIGIRESPPGGIPASVRSGGSPAMFRHV